MNAPGYHFLAGTIFPQDQDRGIGGGNDPDVLFQFFYNIRCTQYLHKGQVSVFSQCPGNILIFFLFMITLFYFNAERIEACKLGILPGFQDEIKSSGADSFTASSTSPKAVIRMTTA